MAGYLSYSKLNSLEEFSFIAGTDYTLEFEVFEEDGVTPLDLGGGSVAWVLCPLGQPDYAVLQETGTITGTNTFEVVLPSADTQDLAGKYIQQPVVTDFSGNVFRAAQGVVLILSKIPVI